MVGVVVQDVILDFVVGHEAKFAVRTLARFAGHGSIVGRSPPRRPGSKVQIRRRGRSPLVRSASVRCDEQHTLREGANR